VNDPSPLDSLRLFLFNYVATYEELEVLLLLHSKPEQYLHVEVAAKETGIPVETARTALENLAARGLLVTGASPGAFRYAPANKALAMSAEQVQRAYRNARMAIIQMMTSNAMERVRADAIRRIAEARLRRDVKGER
jgi:predicted ArsR family transcriptional regulator